jgi:hypothetical protein
MSIISRQQTVLLLKMPYDVLNIVNSFLFYERVVGETRKQKKHVCDLFTEESPHFVESKTLNFYGKVFGGILSGKNPLYRDRITRFSYCHGDGWVDETSATSVFTSIKIGNKIKQKWNGFCNSCGDYTYIAQDFLWAQDSEVEFYSPNMDVLCLCELDGIATVGTRRRPYPVGKALR